jgi:hypothetical protein
VEFDKTDDECVLVVQIMVKAFLMNLMLKKQILWYGIGKKFGLSVRRKLEV